jgi:uncharacterized protein YjaZ
MSKIKLLIAEANNYFSANEIEKLNTAAVLAEQFFSNNFDFDYEVNVFAVSPSYPLKVIPEDGISGKTYRSDLIIIVINKEIGFSQDFFYETLCHELAHSLRWQKVDEHSATLFDEIIFEGLAILLEEKTMAENDILNTQYFLKEIQSTDQAMIDKIILKLDKSLNGDGYDYNKIFISGDDELPRWAGYRLGYYLVKKYLKDNNTDIFKAVFDKYKSFQVTTL